MSFLSAQWRKLVMVNYEIDPEVLRPYVPAGTELDFYQGRSHISNCLLMEAVVFWTIGEESNSPVRLGRLSSHFTFLEH